MIFFGRWESNFKIHNTHQLEIKNLSLKKNNKLKSTIGSLVKKCYGYYNQLLDRCKTHACPELLRQVFDRLRKSFFALLQQEWYVLPTLPADLSIIRKIWRVLKESKKYFLVQQIIQNKTPQKIWHQNFNTKK